jgi:hypothetical protein
VRAGCSALAVLAAVAVSSCGNPTAAEERLVEKAFREQIAASKRGDAATYCHKTASSLSLPRSIAHRLHVPAQAPPFRVPGAPPAPEPSVARWRAECTRHYRAGGETRIPVPRFEVHATLDPPMRPLQGITRTAHLTIIVDGKRSSYRAPAIRYRGDWKMVSPEGG